MTCTKPRLVVAWAAAAISLSVLTGCVGRSEYDAKVAELKKQSERAAASQQETAQLQTDLDAAKADAEKAAESPKGRRRPAQKAEEQIAQLKKQAQDGSQAEKDLEAKLGFARTGKRRVEEASGEAGPGAAGAEQLRKDLDAAKKDLDATKKDLDAAKAATDKAEQANKDAQAKIKALEEENANLKKRPPAK